MLEDLDYNSGNYGRLVHQQEDTVRQMDTMIEILRRLGKMLSKFRRCRCRSILFMIRFVIALTDSAFHCSFRNECGCFRSVECPPQKRKKTWSFYAYFHALLLKTKMIPPIECPLDTSFWSHCTAALSAFFHLLSFS